MSEGNDEYGEMEIFGQYGPSYLTNIDWTRLDHRKTVAASLVKGVYVQERDRHRRENGFIAVLAPSWWETFHFQHIQDIQDEHDNTSQKSRSIFGAIFEYKPTQQVPLHNRPPKYVIAFRGTILERHSFVRDLYLDGKLIFNQKPRYRFSIEVVQNLINRVGPENVWLAGHSLGAAIALQVGKTMAKDGNYIETYLFNPPFCELPIEMLSNPYLKTRLRVARNLLTVVVSNALKVSKNNNKSSTTPDEDDSFNMLRPWKPYLFVNQNDPICCEYIGYFEHRLKMETSGLGWMHRKIAKKSVVSVVTSAYGNNDEALHLVPSAILVKSIQVEDSHGLRQWWRPHSNLQPTIYHF